MISRSFPALLLTVIFCLPFTVLAEEASTPDPEEVVTRLQEVLLESMKAGENLSYQERLEMLRPTILETHRFEDIGRVVLGGKWKNLSPTDQVRFIDTFTTTSLSLYVVNFDSYSGEEFTVRSSDALKGKEDFAVVRSDLKRPNDDDVDFQYILQRKDDEWKIINVIANGVSDLALKRAEYTQIIDEEGFDHLLNSLIERIRQRESGDIDE